MDSTTSPEPPATETSFPDNYVGCYGDDRDARALTLAYTASDSMTTEVNDCASSGAGCCCFPSFSMYVLLCRNIPLTRDTCAASADAHLLVLRSASVLAPECHRHASQQDATIDLILPRNARASASRPAARSTQRSSATSEFVLLLVCADKIATRSSFSMLGC